MTNFTAISRTGLSTFPKAFGFFNKSLSNQSAATAGKGTVTKLPKHEKHRGYGTLGISIGALTGVSVGAAIGFGIGCLVSKNSLVRKVFALYGAGIGELPGMLVGMTLGDRKDEEMDRKNEELGVLRSVRHKPFSYSLPHALALRNRLLSL